MRRLTLVLVLALALALALVVPVAAQEPSPQAVAQAYYAALAQGAAGGDLSAVLDLFGDDATVSVPTLSAQAVSGKEAIRRTFAGIGGLMKGMTVTVDSMAVDGDTVTVTYRLTSATGEVVPAQDVFVVSGGKIASLAVNINAPTQAAQGSTAVLPATGGAFAALGDSQLLLVALAALPLLAPLGKRK